MAFVLQKLGLLAFGPAMGSRRPRCSADTRSETPAIRNDTDSIQRDLDPEKTSDREQIYSRFMNGMNFRI